MLYVRPSLEADLPAIYEIYGKARAHMRAEGNMVQWGDSDLPEKKIPSDIEKGISFVITDDEGTVRGTFAFLLGEDPTYAYIEDGSWPDELPYGTIHRIASDQMTKGILAAAVAFAASKTDRLRIDTHENNRTMRACVTKQGFLPAGRIYVSDGTPRLAFYKNFA